MNNNHSTPRRGVQDEDWLEAIRQYDVNVDDEDDDDEDQEYEDAEDEENEEDEEDEDEDDEEEDDDEGGRLQQEPHFQSGVVNLVGRARRRRY